MPGVDDRTGQYDEFDRPADGRIAALATRQHGVVATWQLTRLGYSHTQVSDRCAAGWLHRIHRGVYAVGHRRLSQNGRWMAAVLACGAEAVLSHQAAVALWELRPRRTGLVDATVPGRRRHGQRGIRVHNVRTLAPTDRTVLDGIPVTSFARTVLDHAEIAARRSCGSRSRRLSDGSSWMPAPSRSCSRAAPGGEDAAR
jgi:predicted transcriptional regulator of viral defense system